MNSFFDHVYTIVEIIPSGKVVSYGQIAQMLGQPRAARQVGWAMSCCPDHLPWHRVVMADGSIAGGIHADMRRALLENEGILFLPDGRVDMKSFRWTSGSLICKIDTEKK
jgi:methylated-DNA-protein-cysteine methyltransferase-like protein